MMFLLFLIFPLLISCSNSDKFNAKGKPEIELDIVCGQFAQYIYASAFISLNDELEYYYYYWLIDGERFNTNKLEMEKRVSYGEHFLEFVLKDISFGDTLSKGCTLRINEPLKIALLSPIEPYEATKTDMIEFQYRISGLDTWEGDPQIAIYISTNKDLLWQEGEIIENNFLKPPLKERVYYWGIKAFTERDTAFSEIRSIWIKN